jgi:hypothetical protein
MKKVLGLIGALILFFLAWAAGHDILSGENDVWMEYSMIAFSLVIAGLALIHEATVLRKTRLCK